MSVLGTGVAAGVAQSTLQARQVAQERQRAEQRAARPTRHSHRSAESTSANEEDELGIEPVDELAIDGRLPQHQPFDQQPKPASDGPHGLTQAAEPSPQPPPIASQDDHPPLHRHVDVQA